MQEIPWRKNIIEITDLPEKGFTEDDLTNLAKPFGLTSTPVIAITQKRVMLSKNYTNTHIFVFIYVFM